MLSSFSLSSFVVSKFAIALQIDRAQLGDDEWHMLVPLLDLVEALEKRDGDEDDDRLLSVTDLDL